MKSLTVAFITSRNLPRLDWFYDSLKREWPEANVLVIAPERVSRISPPLGITVTYSDVKPTIWQGKHRLPKEDWWANSNARNTAICLCKTEWIAFLDDRCVILPGWLDAIKEAMNGGYAMCGAYEKRTGITVENGIIKHAGIVTGVDTREIFVHKNDIPPPYPCPGSWFFGCNFALPIEWALQVGGFPEIADSLGMEDVLFGLLLQNNKFPIKYDLRSRIIEDRTPGETGPVMRREDFGVSPNDKSHALLAMFTNATSSLNIFNIRALRNSVLRGEPFPIPSKPTRDWWDRQLISEFT